MAQQSEGQWVTINGRHVLIREGETATEAVNRSIAEHNADLKEKQIAQRKEEADRLNGNVKSVYDGTSQKMFGKKWGELTREEKQQVVDAYNKELSKDPTMAFLTKYTGKSPDEIKSLEGKSTYQTYPKFQEQFKNGINPWEKQATGSRASYNDKEWAEIQRNYKLADEAIKAMKKK